MLTELDRELERRGLPFVRYADDCNLLQKPRAAERVCEASRSFIEGKLFLKVNREKTHVGSVHGQKYLGYSFKCEEKSLACAFIRRPKPNCGEAQRAYIAQ